MYLNGIFKDDMVFQRDRDIRVFGVVEKVPEDVVRAMIYDGSGNVISEGETSEICDDGFFLVQLPALSKGGPYTMIVESVKNHEELRLNGIYIGEVWIAGGQSNMEYPLMRSEGASRVVKACPETNIHFYKVPVFANYTEEQAMAEEESRWVTVNGQTCGDMSAVAFYFAFKVTDYLASREEDLSDLHFGIIGCYLGGTSVSCWQSEDSLMSTKEGRKYIDEYENALSKVTPEEYEEMKKEYDAECAAHEVRLRRLLGKDPFITYADAEKELGPGAWPPPVGPTSDRRPGALFDTMVLRIVPFNVRGVIFYQGETDADDHSEDYAVVFRTMIEEWREVFCIDDMPFIFCQLPMYTTKDRKFMGYDDMKWPRLRACQQKVARTVPNTYMAVLADCGEFDNLHPSDKKTPGFRMAQLALRFVYGYDLPAVSPYVVDLRRGDGVEITFDGDFSRLDILAGQFAEDTGFEIADEKGIFHPAPASVDFDGKTIVLKCRDVESASAVRYAFFSYGSANLVSDTGLAAAPFSAKLDNSIGDFY